MLRNVDLSEISDGKLYDAASTHTGLASAGSSLWDASTKTTASGISCRCMNVRSRPKPRLKSINGWIPMIYAPTSSSSVTGTIFSKHFRNGLAEWRIRHRYVPSVCTYCSSSTSRLAKTSMKHSTEDLTKQSGTLRCKI